MIKDLHDVLNLSNESFIKSQLRRAVKPMPKATDETITLNAEVNHGRWIVRCPFCKGAEIVDKQDLRFFCLACHNEQNGGKWIKIAMPGNLVKIEAELIKRPKERFMNWRPGETLIKLKVENKERGII